MKVSKQMVRKGLNPDSKHPLAIRQQGMALMIMMLIMVLGTSWALVNAINGASSNTVSEQKKTGDSLVLAKYALLGYIAQQALTSNVPGMFLCPESTSSIGTSNEGTTATSCSTLPAIGRLPWKTLGIDKPLDGSGEALWYVVGSSVRTAPINFSTADSTVGKLFLDGTPNAAVAVIIAPGAALNTASSTSTAPPPCVNRNQSSGRNSSPLNSSDFVECGNATLAAFVSSRNDSWGNDRVVAITALEMLKAIEGAVADRIQRVVVPALNGTAASTGWYQKNSYSEWGAYFFPYASSWSDPTSNGSCGTYGVTEGLLPIASGDVTSGTGCSARWTSATVTKVSGTAANKLDSYTCTPGAAQMTCVVNYTKKPGIEIIVTAPNIAMGFRTRPASGEITATVGNSVSSGPSGAIVSANGNGTVTFQMSLVNNGGTVTINIPNPSDSFLINTSTTTNADLAWFINNQWNYYTYYAISPAVTANPSGTCTSANVTNCLTLTNAEAGTGNVNDKRIALVLSGRPLTGKTQPSASMSDYFEAQNVSTGDRNFQRDTISTAFNDRPSVCPFQRQTTGSANVLCN